MSRSEPTVLKWLNIVAWLAIVAVNALSQLLPINGVTTGEVSDAYPNLFSPAPFTFAIWGVIYVLLLGFVVYQTGWFKHRAPDSAFAARRVGSLFILSSLFNIAWIFAWHYYKIGLSLLCMIALFLCLAIAFSRLTSIPLSKADRTFVRLPFAVYFSWICVALIANVTTYLVSVDWAGFGISPIVWAVVLVAVAAIIGVITIRKSLSWVYGVTLLWALAGIFVKHTGSNGFDGHYPAVIWTTAAAWLLVAGFTIYAATRKQIV